MNEPIDIIIPWVDDTDPKWKMEYLKWRDISPQDDFEKSNVRFESWSNLHLW